MVITNCSLPWSNGCSDSRPSQRGVIGRVPVIPALGRWRKSIVVQSPCCEGTDVSGPNWLFQPKRCLVHIRWTLENTGEEGEKREFLFLCILDVARLTRLWPNGWRRSCRGPGLQSVMGVFRGSQAYLVQNWLFCSLPQKIKKCNNYIWTIVTQGLLE